MITKIFKVSTKEMWILQNKKELIYFIEREMNIYVSEKLTIEQLLKYLPKENYCEAKKGE